MLSGIRHLLRCRRHAGQHHLLLVDNLALALACPKGRGSSSLANRTCQQLCALALASDSKFHVRWIPSERNCADRPSREPWLKKARRSLVAHPSIVDGVGDKDFAAHGRASRASNQEEDMQDSRQRQCNRAHPGRRPFALGGEQGAPDLNPGSLQRRGGDLTDYDCLLTAYLNELYAQGADVSAAEYTFAAFRYRFPDYGKHGTKALARAIQALGLPQPGPSEDAAPDSRRGFRRHRGCLVSARSGRDGAWAAPSMGFASTPAVSLHGTQAALQPYTEKAPRAFWFEPARSALD